MSRNVQRYLVVSEQMESNLRKENFRWTAISHAKNSTLEELAKRRIKADRCTFTYISTDGMDPVRKTMERVRRAKIIIQFAAERNLAIIAENDLIEVALRLAGADVLVTLKSVKTQSRKTKAEKIGRIQHA